MIRKQEVIVKKKNGKMENKNFLRLQKALQQEPWKDPTLEVDADDGVAWEIESYREDGSVEKASGKLGYIYGHRNLERIVGLLPSDGNIYDSKAFVAINRRRFETTENVLPWRQF